MIEAKSSLGRVRFDGQYVTFTRHDIKGEKRFHVSRISAVRWKPASFFENGYIQFSLPGGNARSGFANQSQTVLKDENGVTFTRRHQAAFEAVRAAIERAIDAHHTPRSTARKAAPSIADELTKLAGLLKQGLITQRDYDAAKARLLGL